MYTHSCPLLARRCMLHACLFVALPFPRPPLPLFPSFLYMLLSGADVVWPLFTLQTTTAKAPALYHTKEFHHSATHSQAAPQSTSSIFLSVSCSCFARYLRIQRGTQDRKNCSGVRAGRNTASETPHHARRSSWLLQYTKPCICAAFCVQGRGVNGVPAHLWV